MVAFATVTPTLRPPEQATRGAVLDNNDDLLLLHEEREYFRSKYLEQATELSELKEELSKSRSEIRRLRLQLMGDYDSSVNYSDNNSRRLYPYSRSPTDRRPHARDDCNSAIDGRDGNRERPELADY